MSTTPPFAPWVVSIKPNSLAKLRLFCFPYAGGGASIFRNWSHGLSTNVEVCPLQLPGRETRINEPPFTRLLPLVEAIAPALLPLLDKPFAFFGHSMGALVSFELTRLLRRQYGLAPVHLFVSGASAPHVSNFNPPTHNLPEPEFIKELHSLSGTPKEVLDNTELMQLMLPTLRADFAVCQTYLYLNEPPVNSPISVFSGLEEKVSYKHLEAWHNQTSASFSLQMFPGNHFFLHTAQLLLLKSIVQQLCQSVNI
ncbi:thioesterase II family protein [Nostoc sp. CCY 9925]|uniref:thioesterase II family protein n=1 Tax=Nostoc sp. CCY 9925 TaxID=3103865 RepID=UPI0039C613B0